MEKEQLHNRIVREIIARVASGEYPAGWRLPAERVLCREFDVARGTLRKALTYLKELSVLTIKPNSGIYVRELSETTLPQSVLPPDFRRVDLQDIIDARKAIELAAFKQATKRITNRELEQLRHLVDRMAASVDDLPAFLHLDMAFHRAIVQASGNVVLRTAYEAIHEYHRFSAIYTSQGTSDEREALDYHRRWLAALEKKDYRTGSQILSKHLDAIVKTNSRPVRPKANTPRTSKARNVS